MPALLIRTAQTQVLAAMCVCSRNNEVEVTQKPLLNAMVIRKEDYRAAQYLSAIIFLAKIGSSLSNGGVKIRIVFQRTSLLKNDTTYDSDSALYGNSEQSTP